MACGPALAVLVVAAMVRHAGDRDELRLPAPFGPTGTPAVASVVDLPRATEDALAGVPAAPKADPARSVSGRADERRPVVAPQASEDLFWIEGRVVLPPGTPADEHVEVVADPPWLEPSPTQGAPVGADGRFRVAAPHGDKACQLHVVARYVYLEQPHPITLDEPHEDIVLEPTLGGRIVGRVTPPDGLLPERLVGTEVQWLEEPPQVLRAPGPSPRARVAPDLTFELNAVPCERSGRVAYAPDFLVQHVLDGVEMTAGRETRVELRPRVGARVRGHVLRPGGEPVEGAEVKAEGTWANGAPPHRRVRTSADGTFDLRYLPAGELVVVAEANSIFPARWGPKVLADGQEVSAVDIVLGAGRTLTGRVEYPDGSAAHRKTVYLARSDTTLTTRTDEDGRFEFLGLDGRPCQLTVGARRRSGGVDARKLDWGAAIEILPGMRSLVVTLSCGGSLAGQVLDDLGQPITTFEVRARRETSVNGWRRATIQKAVEEAPDGRFLLDNVLDGTWHLVAESQGVGSLPLDVRMPDAGFVTLTIPRPASLSGRVVDELGNPVGGSEVSVGARGDREPFTKTGPDGAFQLEGLPAGRVRIDATAPGFADSIQFVSLEPGRNLDGVSCRLSVGGTLTGELDSDGFKGQSAYLRIVELDWFRTATIDDSGRFRAEHVPAGDCEVFCQPVRQKPDGTVYMRAKLRASATVREGESVHVVLRY